MPRKDTEQIKEYHKQYYQQRTKLKRKEQRENREPLPQRECAVCHSMFTPSRKNEKCCSDACKKLRIKLKEVVRKHTTEYKEKLKAYRQTEQYKERLKAYRQTEKYKEYQKKYSKTDTFKEIAKRYLQSEKGKATHQRYAEKRKANNGKPLNSEEG